jgi:hypothetical protein
VYVHGQNKPVGEIASAEVFSPGLFARTGPLIYGMDGQVYDVRTWQRLLPPPGRRFHPDLARFSPDGRFVSAFIGSGFFGESVVIDTRTDKQFPVVGEWRNPTGFGFASSLSPSGDVSSGQVANGELQFFPPADRLNLPPDLLELWAQVAVRGHLDERGAFVPWDEATWEKRRQELAAKRAPVPDFPFPGYVAIDKLHWLRQEYENAKDVAKPALAAKLLAGAEAIGDKAEAVRWRAVLEKDAKRSPQR